MVCSTQSGVMAVQVDVKTKEGLPLANNRPPPATATPRSTYSSSDCACDFKNRAAHSPAQVHESQPTGGAGAREPTPLDGGRRARLSTRPSC